MATPPRKPEDINRDFAQLCTQLGEIDFRLRVLEEQQQLIRAKIKLLSAEMDVAALVHPKPTLVKPEEPKAEVAT
jgi:hypothetical protein